jgi:hypothetical protein
MGMTNTDIPMTMTSTPGTPPNTTYLVVGRPERLALSDGLQLTHVHLNVITQLGGLILLGSHVDHPLGSGVRSLSCAGLMRS